MSEEKKDEGADLTDHIMSMSGVATNTDAKETSSERSLPQSAVAESFIESKNSITKTTRENDDNISNDSRIKNMDENGNNTTGSSTRNSSPLVLLLCACGITSCYLWYGTVQERLFIKHGNNKNDRANGNENITLFLLATNTFSSFLIGWAWIVVGPLLLKNEVTSSGNASDRINKCSNNTEIDFSNSKLNHPLLALTSLTYLTAMAASNEALHYVSYPTCVLAKSSKLIPTMLVGWLVDTWRCWRLNAGKKNHHNGKSTINAMEWVGAALITIGILSFQYIQLHKQKKKENGNEQVQGDSPYGLVYYLLCIFDFHGI